MRLIVLLFMIALLPLRALAGDVMATQMAGFVVAIEKEAARAHNTGATSYFDHQKQLFETPKALPDCHEQQASGHDDADVSNSANPAATSVSDHCNTCAACQACHTVALSPTASGGIPAFASPQLRQTSRAQFTSADAALGQKPPIS